MSDETGISKRIGAQLTLQYAVTLNLGGKQGLCRVEGAVRGGVLHNECDSLCDMERDKRPARQALRAHVGLQ